MAKQPLKTTDIASKAFTIWTEGEVTAKQPPLMVVQVMVSGRHVRCRLVGSTLPDIVCQVGNAANFRGGMLIRTGAKDGGAVVRAPGTDERLWIYTGKLPRRSGHW